MRQVLASIGAISVAAVLIVGGNAAWDSQQRWSRCDKAAVDAGWVRRDNDEDDAGGYKAYMKECEAGRNPEPKQARRKEAPVNNFHDQYQFSFRETPYLAQYPGQVAGTERCRSLARQRGWAGTGAKEDAGRNEFIAGCMSGKYR